MKPLPLVPAPVLPVGKEVEKGWMNAMRAGDWEAAWWVTDGVERIRRRLQADGQLVWGPEFLLWDGSAFAGREVVVRCSHGLGDTLQFARLFAPLGRIASSVTIMAQPALVELLRIAGGMGRVMNGWAAGAEAGRGTAKVLEVECMELAYAFRATPETLPGPVPWISPRAVLGAVPNAFFTESSGLQRVGLVWGASEWDVSRSIPLGALAGLGEVRGVEFYSLQQGAEAERISEVAFPLRTLGRSTEAILDAAAAMLALDLVITVDTMAAHLAGALGRPVWLLLQAEADWRWMAGRTDSPWYPTMRIFRQRVAGEWGAVVEEVVAALGEMANDQ